MSADRVKSRRRGEPQELAAVGFRVKSGWATVILLGGPPGAPKVIDRRTVQLADPGIPESAQPYHAGLELPMDQGPKEVARLVKVVERYARRSVAEVIDSYRNDGHRLVGAGIVVGSEVDPATIKNDHIRAHAEEGRLFRVVIEEAVKECGLPASVTADKQVLAKASKAIRRPEPRLKEDVKALGKAIGGRWRGEEKAATLAAWMLLA
jgi:hypothetical protein